jgi:hypothetical protein
MGEGKSLAPLQNISPLQKGGGLSKDHFRAPPAILTSRERSDGKTLEIGSCERYSTDSNAHTVGGIFKPFL